MSNVSGSGIGQGQLVTPARRSYTEALTVFEPARLALNGWRLVARRTRHPQTVMVLPGFGGNDPSTAPLRAYLRGLGHDVHGWSLGTNRGDMQRALTVLEQRVGDLAARPPKAKVALVGWSLGGVLSRELARRLPDLVSQVITLGSPVVGGPKYTSLAHAYRRLGVDLDQVEREAARRAEVPAHIPITVIYSRSDGVVAWQACIDHVNAHAEHVEVRTTHLGLGIHHEVWRIVADRLADPRPAAAGAQTP